jgi:lysophospholipase L1-like esterase
MGRRRKTRKSTPMKTPAARLVATQAPVLVAEVKPVSARSGEWAGVRKTALTVLSLAVLMTVPDYLPAFKDYKVLDWKNVPTVLDFVPRAETIDPVAEESTRMRPDRAMERFGNTPLVDPHGALDRFYDTLQTAEESKAEVRIAHYGDSPTTGDLITGDVRDLLQKRFGEGGPGFHLIARPWAWYAHRGVQCNSGGWQIDVASFQNSRRLGGTFGFGGASFRGLQGAWTEWKLDRGAETVEVAYWVDPSGGAFAVSAGEGEGVEVETAAADSGPAWRKIQLPANARQVQLRVTKGSVRLFGVNFTRSSGVTYHSLGLNGAYVSVLARMFDEKHWARQLQHYDPHLVIVNYGTNESLYPEFVDTKLAIELTDVVRRIRTALPDASILIMSPMDRGTRSAGGAIATVPALPRVVTIQQRVAAENRVAFYNTFQAMGGEGTMGKWYQAEPRLVSADFIHPMPAGAKIVGNLFHRAMTDGYKQYRVRLMKERLAQQAAKR